MTESVSAQNIGAFRRSVALLLRTVLCPAKLLFPVALLLLPFGRPCLAQLETGEIVGKVLDASGAVFPGAQVVVQNVLTGATTTLTTGRAGTFDAPILPPGDYNLTASAPGFKTLVANNVHIHVGDRKSVDFKLEPGTVQESVNVTSSAVPLIDTAKSDTGNTVTSEKVNNVPLENHSYANLLSLAPGVVNFGVLAANGGSSNYFESAIRIEIDGTDASQVDSDFVGPAYNSNQRLDRGSVDAIQELQIETGSYNAEYGQSNGAIFNLVTKSGTNDFHGDLFEYFRNNDLDASPDYFGHTNAPLHINQFGGSIGGPIIKNRLFFFTNYEGIQQSNPVVFDGVLDPSAAFRATVDPRLQSLVAQIPLPNAGITSFNPGLGYYNGVRTAKLTENNVSFKIDYQATDNDKFSVRWNGTPSTTLSPFGISEGQSRDVQGLTQDGRVSYTKVLTPTLYNEASVAFNRIKYIDAAANDPTVRAEPLCFGSGNGGTCFGPTTFDINVANTSYTYLDTLSWVKGRNQFKFGIQAIRNWQNKALNLQIWSNFLTQAQFAADNPYSYQPLGYPMTGVRLTYWNGFAQDDIQVNTKLALNVGVRYSYDTAPTIAHNIGENWDFATNSLAPMGAPTTHTPKDEFAPRVGFAYTPFDSRKTVIRAAFGVFYNDINVAQAQEFEDNYLGANVIIFNFQDPTLTLLPGPSNLALTAAGHNVWGLPPNWKNSYTYQWNFTVQQQLGVNNMLSVAYVGNSTSDLSPAIDINQIQPNGQRLYPGYGFVNIYTPCCHANYNALQTTFKRRLSNRLSFDVFYTWSHTLDQGNATFGTSSFQNQNNLDAEYGNSDLDVRHNLTVDYVYQLPDVPRIPKVIGGGWQVSGITQARSGLPYTITCGACTALTGDGVLRPNLILPDDVLTGNNGHTGAPVLNLAAFAPVSGYAVYGNLGRNTQHGPSAINFDISAGKSFKVTERQRILFRAELLNAFNHPNWGLPDANISDGGNFGRVFNVTTGRNIQLVGRYEF